MKLIVLVLIAVVMSFVSDHYSDRKKPDELPKWQWPPDEKYWYPHPLNHILSNTYFGPKWYLRRPDDTAYFNFKSRKK
jgi:hypothetical protein